MKLLATASAAQQKSDDVLLARGVAPAFILLLMVFLFVFTLPVFLPSAALLGLSDVWLDYRRLEASPREGS